MRTAQTLPDSDAVTSLASVVRFAGLWSLLAFILNLAWEIAHVWLYAIWATADGMEVAWALFHCTLGDVLIALAMFVLAGIVLWRANWPASRPWTGGVIVVTGAMAFPPAQFAKLDINTRFYARPEMKAAVRATTADLSQGRSEVQALRVETVLPVLVHRVRSVP